MKHCKNCIHDKVCDMWAVESGMPFANANTCNHFKDKSLVLDLPCKVGDTVYFFDEFYKRITEFQVTGIEIVVSCKSLRGGLHAFSLSSFGKTLFHQREAAERTLKEREQ